MVPRLAQVVRELDAVVRPIDELDRAIRLVELVASDEARQLRRLCLKPEPDQFFEDRDGAIGDSKVEQRMAVVDRNGAVLANVSEGCLLRFLELVGADEDCKRREQ